ncbi:MAG TPA: hypothetical protein VKE72_07755 [Methylocella sp.]|nr:hypothetical protein [Methylocella sp.]
MAQAKTDPTRIDDLDDLKDVWQQWRARLGLSHEVAEKLEALLRNRETRSAFVSASGELWPLDGEFWRDMARLEVVPDADGVGDRLEVRRPTYVNGDGPFSDSPGGTFLVRRTDAERWEAALPPAPCKERKPAPKKKRRKAKQASRSGAPEQHDWEEGKLFVMQELKSRGSPLDKNNQTKGWKTISDVARLVIDHLEKLSDDGVGPDMSTTRGKVSDWIKEFERGRN